MKNNRVIWIIMLAAGLLEVGVFGFMTVRTLETRNWPSVSGRITTSRLHSYISRSSDNSSSTRMYTTRISYRFHVKNKAYVGKTLSYGEYSSSSPSHAKGILKKYPVGAKVTVFYNPANPDKAVLEPGKLGILPIFWVCALVFLGLGIWGVFIKGRK